MSEELLKVRPQLRWPEDQESQRKISFYCFHYYVVVVIIIVCFQEINTNSDPLQICTFFSGVLPI